MSDPQTPKIGSIGWTDLTVPDAARIRDFYCAVVGWTTEAVPMGEYDDYCMVDAGGTSVAGVCHARGANAGMPPSWLIYLNVADLEASAARCVELGGRLVAEPREIGSPGRYCVIEDPAGAVAALFAPAG